MTDLIPNAKTLPPTKRIAGVYFLLKAGEVQYIGQSANLLSRVMCHEDNRDRRKTKWFRGHWTIVDFDEVRYLEYSLPEIDEAERYWIAKLNPPKNRNAGGGAQKGRETSELRDAAFEASRLRRLALARAYHVKSFSFDSILPYTPCTNPDVNI